MTEEEKLEFRPQPLEGLTKKYYKISEVAELIGEGEYTLRFWETKFEVLNKHFCSLRSHKGTRQYSHENIENLRLIQYLLRTKRMTIEGAISAIRSSRHRNAKERAMTQLLDVRTELVRMINSYTTLIENENMHHWADADAKGN